MPAMYHLDLDAARIRGARVALLPGDPGRSRLIAERIAAAHGARTAERPLASNREFCTYLAEIAGAPRQRILVTGSGGADTLATMENLIGSASDDTLTGDALANTLIGNAGGHVLNRNRGPETGLVE